MADIKKLNLGVAYHSNKIFRHVEEDMRELVRNDMNTVVHMYTHNDMERHREVFRDIVSLSQDLGLDVWVDNWGIEGTPGDRAHFLAYYPDERMYYSDGRPHPFKVCYNSSVFRSFVHTWIEQVAETGAKKIFWDEPHMIMENGQFTCACPHCRALFRERYGYDMPSTLTPEVASFRADTIGDYFSDITAYAAKLGLESTVCVMFNPEQGISIYNLDVLGNIPTLGNIGCDPYWIGYASGTDVYDYVYDRTKLNLDFCEKKDKDHNIWIQGFIVPSSREDEVILACDAAYDAGARTILGWSFRGGESNDYRSDNPDKLWAAYCLAMKRLKSRHFDTIRASLAK